MRINETGLWGLNMLLGVVVFVITGLILFIFMGWVYLLIIVNVWGLMVALHNRNAYEASKQKGKKTS